MEHLIHLLMKVCVFVLCFLSSFSFGQIDQSGFGEIRIGKSYNDLKKRISRVESVPEYAWFAPMSVERFMKENGQDSTGYSEFLEYERLSAEEDGEELVWCTFKKKNEANYFQIPIECAQLTFVDGKLSEIMLVFDKNDLTSEVKTSILQQIESVLGEPSCSYAATLPPQAFTCSWYKGKTEVLVSDAIALAEGYGESLNISFLSF